MTSRKYTDAKREANKRWDKENISRVSVALKIDEREQVQAAAARAGESVNSYIKAAIRQRMERDGLRASGDPASTTGRGTIVSQLTGDKSSE